MTRRSNFWPKPWTTRTTWRPWTPCGKKPWSPSDLNPWIHARACWRADGPNIRSTSTVHPNHNPITGGNNVKLHFWCFSVHRPDYHDRRQHHPLRDRSVFMEDEIQPVAAHPEVRDWICAVPCWSADHFLRSLVRTADATAGLQLAGHQQSDQASARHDGGRNRRSHRAERRTHPA